MDDPIFIGNISGQFTPLPNAKFTKTLYDLDVLIRPNFAIEAEVESLLPEAYSQDEQYQGMYYVDYSKTDGEGLTTQVDLRYLGFKNGVPPPAKPISTKSLLTATVNTITRSESIPGYIPVASQVTFQVRCPGTVWTWFETTKPSEEPRNKTIISKQSPWDKNNIVFSALQRAQFAQNELLKQAYDRVLDKLRDYKGGILETYQDYQQEEIVPGRIWRCMCSAIRQPDPIGTTLEILID